MKLNQGVCEFQSHVGLCETKVAKEIEKDAAEIAVTAKRKALFPSNRIFIFWSAGAGRSNKSMIVDFRASPNTIWGERHRKQGLTQYIKTARFIRWFDQRPIHKTEDDRPGTLICAISCAETWCRCASPTRHRAHAAAHAATHLSRYGVLIDRSLWLGWSGHVPKQLRSEWVVGLHWTGSSHLP
jgi:hypothetical protein